MNVSGQLIHKFLSSIEKRAIYWYREAYSEIVGDDLYFVVRKDTANMKQQRLIKDDI